VFPDYLEHPQADVWLQRQLQKFHEQVPFDGLWLDMNEAANFCSGLNCDLDHHNRTALYCELRQQIKQREPRQAKAFCTQVAASGWHSSQACGHMSQTCDVLPYANLLLVQTGRIFADVML